MRLEPLYRLTFRYPESARSADELLLFAEGRAEGRVNGRFRGANRARQLARGGYLPNLQGAIRTDDDATVLISLSGHGDPGAHPEGRVVAAVVHATDAEAYAWLDGTVGAVAGEVRGGREVVLDVAQLVWEPLA